MSIVSGVIRVNANPQLIILNFFFFFCFISKSQIFSFFYIYILSLKTNEIAREIHKPYIVCVCIILSDRT